MYRIALEVKSTFKCNLFLFIISEVGVFASFNVLIYSIVYRVKVNYQMLCYSPVDVVCYLPRFLTVKFHKNSNLMYFSFATIVSLFILFYTIR